MYNNIYVAVDNSPLSTSGIDVGVLLADSFSAHLVGSHVYAAQLHDRRFRQMEGGLPEKFREEEELNRQRDVHDSLITKGLELITDSYLTVFERRCRQAGISFEARSLEGKHYVELRRDIAKLSSDLVIIGALGLGAVDESVIGSVCERVVRHVGVDALVIKNEIKPREDSRCQPLISVAVDGSDRSFGGLITALDLSVQLDLEVEAVSVFDPFFHTVAFRSIANVLSEEAGKVFRFEEQEQLHEEIIDSGLAKIYKAQLRAAEKIAEKKGRTIKTRLLAGKAFSTILSYVEEERPWALVVGRSGLHSEEGNELGATAENLLRLAKCNVLLTASAFTPPAEELAEDTTSWTKEAEARMTRVPGFVRGMARKSILDFAREEGHTVITSDIVDKAVASILPASAQEAMGMIAEVGKGGHSEDETGAARPLAWSVKANSRLARIPAGVMRDAMRDRIEASAHEQGSSKVTLKIVEEAVAAGRQTMAKSMEQLQPDTRVDQTGEGAGLNADSHGSGTAERRCPVAGMSNVAPATGLDWTTEAMRRLESVPEGFMREMTRARVEAFAGRKGWSQITLEVVEEKLSGWNEHSRQAEATLPWEPDVKARVERIPAVVRGQIILEVEQVAVEEGRESVTSEFFDGVVRKWTEGGMEFHHKKGVEKIKGPEETACELPSEFLKWQLATRSRVFDKIKERHSVEFFNAHLPVVSTVQGGAGQFRIHSSTKGTGLLPKDEYLDYYLGLIAECLERIKGRPFDETAGERIAVAREFYANPDHIDRRRLGLLEIFRGQTFKNLSENPQATVLYTGTWKGYFSLQINCIAEIIAPGDPYFRFLYGMRQLFEYERFHIHQPAYALGYLFWAQEAFDKSPVMGKAGAKIAGASAG